MYDILSGLKGIVCLIDDALVCGKTQQEHDENLTAALQCIQEAGLTLNREKCVFNKRAIKFLGQVVDSNGIKPDPEKTTLADQTQPLRQLLSSCNQWTWGDSQETAFQEVKTILTLSETLCPYNPALPTVVSANASSFGLGAILRQRHASSCLHF